MKLREIVYRWRSWFKVKDDGGFYVGVGEGLGMVQQLGGDFEQRREFGWQKIKGFIVNYFFQENESFV